MVRVLSAPDWWLVPRGPKALPHEGGVQVHEDDHLPKLRDSLRENKFRVQVPTEIAESARTPIERMVAIG